MDQASLALTDPNILNIVNLLLTAYMSRSPLVVHMLASLGDWINVASHLVKQLQTTKIVIEKAYKKQKK